MVGSEIIAINVFGVLVSLFSIFVTFNIYRDYRLNTSIFFIISSVAVFIWNVFHLIFNFIPEDSLSFKQVRILWLILVYSGIIFVYAFIFGYSNLRYEHVNWRLTVYSGIAATTATIFTLREDWITVAYSDQEGWITTVENKTFWSIFSLSILLVNFMELIIPLIKTYAKAGVNQNPLLLMLFAILLAIFSNALEPILTELSLPQALRFLVADIGFLIFFVILLRYPFTGLYDNSVLNQVIVANESGIPQLILSSDRNKAILTSGAIIGINSILEEIISLTPSRPIKSDESIRKIELGLDQFYII
ncbi:MAG: hypothetical protein IH840_15325, partial [Candidatus Heimdallarchaeota archaeon]|nr:hypothetical protein [Candidatus Heimdallarchaeota archaeon]